MIHGGPNRGTLRFPLAPSMGTLRVPIPLSLGEGVTSTQLLWRGRDIYPASMERGVGTLASPQRGREFYPIVHHVRVLTVTYCLP